MTVIVVLAATLRVVDVTENPPGFFTDEAAVGYNAHTILTSGKDEHGARLPLLFRSFGDYKLGVGVYATVPFVAIFGKTEFAVRLTGVVLGLAAILAIYFLATAIFESRQIGVISALVLAILPWHIHYSRTGFTEMLSFLPLLIFGLYAFVRGVEKKEWLLAGGLLLGLTLHTYRAAWLVVPPLVILLVILYRRELMTNQRTSLYALTILVMMALPIVAHLSSGAGDRAQDAGLLRLSLTGWEKIGLFIEQYRSHFSYSFLFNNGDNGSITRHYLPGFGHLYAIQVPLMLVGILGLVLKPTRKKIIVLTLVFLFPLGGALSDTSPISSRSIIGLIPVSLITSYGLVLLIYTTNKLNLPYSRLITGGFIILALGITLGSLVHYVRNYHESYPSVAAGYWGWQEGPQEIVEYFRVSSEDYDQLVMDGEFNGPHMFFQFYAQERCRDGGCITGNLESYRPDKKQLFALKPRHYGGKYEYRTVHEIRYPNGEVAFLLREVINSTK